MRSESSSNLLSSISESLVDRLSKSFQLSRDTLRDKEFVIDDISNSYELLLLRYPPCYFIGNNESALEHKVFVEHTMNKLEDGVITTTLLKPDFHSRFSLVVSEMFCMGHAQSGETNRTGRKNVFSSVCIGSSNISTSVKLSYSETNQTPFLNHVDILRWWQIFHKIATPKLCQA